MTKVLIVGANGRMGQVLSAAVKSTLGMQVACGVDVFADAVKNEFPVYRSINECAEKPDVIIDFSKPEALKSNLEYAADKGVPIVIATTGLSEEHKSIIDKAAKSVAVFYTANMSLGVSLQMELAKKAAEFLGEDYDIEIVEKHHNQKVDSPSGTALAIADKINEAYADKKEYVFGRHSNNDKRSREIGVHAVRGGTIVGEHTVIFAGTDEIIEIKHSAQSRQIFAYGAIKAANFVVSQPAGLYCMSDML